ncbi:Protein of uncharacterised function (DUF3810) [uncultured Ruminococcus sp.]|nr:Protein of uncharacterised function (DUF3810) [uncultured Ruminococcus sp.]
MAQWYSEHIYPWIVSLIGRFFGIFPFSVAEFLLYAGILLLVGSLVRIIYRLIKKKADKKEGLRYLRRLGIIALILATLYMINCGINYHRNSFAESIELKADTYTVDELKGVCMDLTERVNTYAGHVERDADGVMVLSGNEREEAVAAMERLGEKLDVLAGYYPKPKPLAFSAFLSVQNLTGIYSPFTVEANYNQDMTPYNIPFTACHELSHLRGFMQEEEANFIAWLACKDAPETELQYSGSMLAWIHCMNVLYEEDRAAWSEIREILSEEADVDLRANSEFWDKWDGAVAEVSEQINDNYLKANGQKDGVQSYGRMADLVVAYYLWEE